MLPAARNRGNVIDFTSDDDNDSSLVSGGLITGGQVSAISGGVVSVPAQPRILRAHAPNPTWRKSLFKDRNHNPATRVRRFSPHLYDTQGNSSRRLGHVVIGLPGHLGEELTLADNDRKLGPSRGARTTIPQMCMQPQLELYHDMRVYARLVTLWWARFRLLDPSLRPWSPDEMMTDVNPNVLSSDHPLQQCYPPT